MITPDSPLIGPPSGTLHEAIDYLGDNCAEYLTELWRLCGLVGLDPAILAAQMAHETGDGQSYWWTARRNPAGIGITGDPEQNAASQTWATQTDAARGHVVHLCAYVFGAIHLSVYQYNDMDVRADHVLEQPWAGAISTIRQLTGKWATDPAYHTKLVAKHRAIFGAQEESVSDTLVFGRVPYPATTERHLPLGKWVKAGAPAVPEAVVWHRMLGTLWGTDGWFFGGNAATAYGIGVTSIDGADDAGRIIEWMAPASGLYGESSGPAKAPYGDGAIFVQRFGVNNVNRLTKAIEISGEYGTPLDEPARKSIVALTAYFADQRRIPWDVFPMVPNELRSFVIWHQEFTGPAEKVCPGTVVMGETSALIARVRDVLKAAQTITPQPKPPVYAAPDLPSWWEAHAAQSWPSDADHDGVRYRVARRNVEALKPAVRRSRPDAKAPKSGPNFQVREKANVERVLTIVTTSESGNRTNTGWLLTADGHYVRDTSFTPQIIVKPR